MANPRDSRFIHSPVVVPTKTADIINNFASTLDENVLNVFKAVAKDIDIFKASLFGIVRLYGGYDQMMFLYNNPTQKETDIKEAARMDKYGNIAIGTEYPRWTRAKVDVNGALYAIPQYGLWAKTTADLAGVGAYAWDTELYNPNSDIYQRVASNTAIQFNEPGTYDIRANIFGLDSAAATGDAIQFNLRLNGTPILAAIIGLTASDFVWAHMTKIISVNKGDFIQVFLVAPATTKKYGDANTYNTWLEICKVN